MRYPLTSFYFFSLYLFLFSGCLFLLLVASFFLLVASGGPIFGRPKMGEKTAGETLAQATFSWACGPIHLADAFLSNRTLTDLILPCH